MGIVNKAMAERFARTMVFAERRCAANRERMKKEAKRKQLKAQEKEQCQTNQ